MQQTEISVRMNEPELETPQTPSPKLDISIVVPVMNEEKSVAILFERVSEQVAQLQKSYEIIFVDDGSTDSTFSELQKLYTQHQGIVRVVRFRRNFGKTPALVAGFSRARGDIIFTMDGDLQDDPQEIPRYLEKLEEGYDLVTGWKFPRLDPLSKTFPSRVFNWMVGTMTGVRLHDVNNGFKAYRREIIEDPHVKLYGDFHRFVPVMAHWRGYRIAEIKVKHHPRQYGVSKFGAGRFARGLIDLLNVLFLTSFLRTPLRLFGPLGFWTFFLGVLVDLYVVIKSYFVIHQPIHDQPLLFVGILLMIFGVQFVLAGLQSEMIRHYAFQRGEEYSIKQELD
jgi:glycosyltransferase involved in cell wall biosynthesis